METLTFFSLLVTSVGKKLFISPVSDCPGLSSHLGSVLLGTPEKVPYFRLTLVGTPENIDCDLNLGSVLMTYCYNSLKL